MAEGSASVGFRERLRAALERHALAAAGESVRAAGVRLRDETLRERTESAVLIDADTGQHVSSPVPGTRDQIEIGPLLRAMLPGRRYVLVHSHPADTAFSPGDVAVLLRFPQVCAVVAVGRAGTWYLMSAEPGRPLASLELMAQAYVSAYNDTLPEYEQRRAAGAMTRLQAARAHSHAIWERASAELGLRYDRVEAD